MSLAVAGVTFGIIFVAELPDKTMIATIILSSRYRPWPVFVGAGAGMVVNSAVAVGAGRLLALAPHRVVEAVVAALFAAGASYLILTRESTEERQGEREADKFRTNWHIILASWAVIVVAELGDLTQILTANLAAHYRRPWSVFAGATAALVMVMAIGVMSGRALMRVLPLEVIRKGAGMLLLGFAVYSAVSAAS
ncbi:MAG TPA: TMEM165/GDT1 family protein [Acidimicrobiales bacterium]|nr:TMEM165/GDT1 family protein [Acidimicrobiales bacterium]